MRAPHNTLSHLLCNENDLGFKIKYVSIKAGDPSGQPDGWNEVEVTPVYETKTINGSSHQGKNGSVGTLILLSQLQQFIMGPDVEDTEERACLK